MSNEGRYTIANGRGLTANVWQGVDFERLRNFNGGFLFEDDFLSLPTGRYTATQATAGTFALDDAKGGVALADCNSTTVTQGINVQANSTTGELFIPTAGELIVFEARIKAADIATGPEFFLGLSVIDTTIIATSALSAQSIGFKSITDDGVLLACVKDGSAEVTSASESPTFTVHTLVDGVSTTDGTEWVRLGCRVNGTSNADFYVNGVKVGRIDSNIPATLMVPSLVCQSDGATDSIIHIDWWKFAQVE